MRVRICRQPAGTIDGVRVDHFRPGLIYDIGIQLANVFLTEGWGEAVADRSESQRPANRVAALVLVVDDEIDLRQLTADLLLCNGYDVVQAGHGQEAIVQLREHSPDLVVLDLNMPVMDGWHSRRAAPAVRRPPHRDPSALVDRRGPPRRSGRHAAGRRSDQEAVRPGRTLNAIQAALPHH